MLLASALVEGGKLLFNNDTDAEQNDLTLSLTDSGRSLMCRAMPVTRLPLAVA